MQSPKVLVLDIEISPIVSYTWGLFDQTVSLNQIKADWHVLSWAAKWVGDSKVLYLDQRMSKNVTNDKAILAKLHKLLDQADIVVTQNGKKFDIRKLNARFIIHGFKPPAPYKQIDTCELAKRHFGFTSNKLEYLADKLNTKYKKLAHSKFPGFDLWKAVLRGDKAAWREMERYNKHDVLATEELYLRIAPWGTGVNFRPITGTDACACGSDNYIKRGFGYSITGKYQRFQCTKCGAWSRNGTNLISSKGMRR
jgi:uncharacterized protein YprB with RNaseH-like and TPR domain